MAEVTEIRYRVKLRVGPVRYKNCTFTQGQEFVGPAWLATGAHKDKLEALDPVPMEDEDGGEAATQLIIKHVGRGRYNVINPTTGEPINDGLLTRAQALALVGNDEEHEQGE